MAEKEEETSKAIADETTAGSSSTTTEKSKEPEVEVVEVDDEDVIGPLPTSTDATNKEDGPPPEKKKKQKHLEFEDTYLRSIPKAKCYEKSFMHRDTVTHVLATRTDFIITASADGHVKFWKKQHHEGIEFVKHFRTHLGPIVQMTVNCTGGLMCTVSTDKSMKIFDVPNFDMINMMKLNFVPSAAVAFIHQSADPIQAVAVGEVGSNVIRVYDAKGTNVPINLLDKLHSKPVTLIEYNAAFDASVSVDEMGMMEYWSGLKTNYEHPNTVEWKYKTDTDLYTFAKLKQSPLSLTISPDGRQMVAWCPDRRLRFFKFTTGKLIKIIDETLQNYITDKSKQTLGNTEFQRRLAVEKELERSGGAWSLIKPVYDPTGNFLLYPTMFGVKVLNLSDNTCSRLIGKPETVRYLSIALCRALPGPGEKLQGAALTAEAEASANPTLQRTEPDPVLVCAAYRKNRFYLFTNREPFDTSGGGDKEAAAGGAASANDRDVYNEKPLKEDIITAVDEEAPDKRMTDACVLHTTYGDIHCRLFLKECPRTVENFCTHARQGYYNGHRFHRVIKSFMIQTGDPTGSGMGGESIWGGDFEDEFHPELKHDKPYTISMANAGPNTNGSQFFVTVVPTPWLDGKHTVFGRVTKGMDVVVNISKARAKSKTGRPYEDIQVISITLK